MDIDQAAVFLAGTILTALGFVIIVIAAVVINNIIHKYWKSFGWNLLPLYMQKQEPVIEEPKMERKK
jgi:hypothetical protein